MKKDETNKYKLCITVLKQEKKFTDAPIMIVITEN